MTTVRMHKKESRIVLNFSDRLYSKHKIRQLIKNLEVEPYIYDEKTNTNLFVQNEIKVGIFNIDLILSVEFGQHKLKNFSGMSIAIREDQKENPHIKLHSHPLFKNQYWQTKNYMSGFKIKHLVDAIYHCQRLNHLKCFI